MKNLKKRKSLAITDYYSCSGEQYLTCLQKMNLLLTGSGNSMTNSVTELFKSDSSAVLCSSEGSSTANLSAVKVLTAHAIYFRSN